MDARGLREDAGYYRDREVAPRLSVNSGLGDTVSIPLAPESTGAGPLPRYFPPKSEEDR